MLATKEFLVKLSGFMPKRRPVVYDKASHTAIPENTWQRITQVALKQRKTQTMAHAQRIFDSDHVQQA